MSEFLGKSGGLQMFTGVLGFDSATVRSVAAVGESGLVLDFAVRAPSSLLAK
jgi:hypothetical protein